MPLVAAYAASKYAIEGFSESLAYELGTLGVRVKIVQPGPANKGIGRHIARGVAQAGMAVFFGEADKLKDHKAFPFPEHSWIVQSAWSNGICRVTFP